MNAYSSVPFTMFDLVHCRLQLCVALPEPAGQEPWVIHVADHAHFWYHAIRLLSRLAPIWQVYDFLK